MAKNRVPGRDFFCGDKCEYVCFLHLLYPFAKIVLFLYTTNWCTLYTYKCTKYILLIMLFSVLITLMFLFA